MTKQPEYLVSFCLAQEGDAAAELEAIAALAEYCGQNLRYWEIVYVIGERRRPAIEAASGKLAAIKSLRIVLVRDAISYYRRRMIAASEAIGDVAVLTSFGEAAHAQLLSLAGEAMRTNRVLLGTRPERRLLQPFSHSFLRLISRYRVQSRDLKTIALPRDHLVAILARPTAPIDLRFERKGGALPYVRKKIEPAGPGGGAGLTQRLELVAEIVSNSASRFLSIFALASTAVFALAASYGVYAVAVILLQAHVQPGWFSTAIAQSGTAAFFSLGFAAVALGIAHIVDRLDGGARHDIVEEIGNISFYESVHDLNVELGAGLHKVAAE